MNRIKTLTGVFLLFSLVVSGQSVNKPNFFLTSHETLTILSITNTHSGSVVKAELINYIDGGTFCIDKGTRITTADGKPLKLRSVTGLPQCPEVYRFASFGEKIFFTMNFDPIPEDTKWINIIEGCDDNCVTIYGLVLNEKLNMAIDEAYNLLEEGKTEMGVKLFEEILGGLKGSNHMYEAAIYSTLIELMTKEGEAERKKYYLDELLNSKSPGASLALSNLKTRGIIY